MKINRSIMKKTAAFLLIAGLTAGLLPVETQAFPWKMERRGEMNGEAGTAGTVRTGTDAGIFTGSYMEDYTDFLDIQTDASDTEPDRGEDTKGSETNPGNAGATGADGEDLVGNSEKNEGDTGEGMEIPDAESGDIGEGTENPDGDFGDIGEGTENPDGDFGDIGEGTENPDGDSGDIGEGTENPDGDSGDIGEDMGIPDMDSGNAEEETEDPDSGNTEEDMEFPEENLEDDKGETDELPEIAYHAADEATGIEIQAEAGVVSMPAFFVVTPVESGAEYEMLGMLLSVTQDQYQIYHLSLWDMNGEAVIPDGEVTVKMPVPAGYTEERLGVYRILDDGSRKEQAIRMENGFAVFETNELGLYAVTQKKESTGITLPERLEMTDRVDSLELNPVRLPNISNTQNTAAGTSHTALSQEVPETGDDANPAVWGALMAAAVAVVITIIMKKKR